MRPQMHSDDGDRGVATRSLDVTRAIRFVVLAALLSIGGSFAPASAETPCNAVFTVPAYSAACSTCCEPSPYGIPAKVKRIRLWVLNAERTHPKWNVWQSVYGLTYTPAGRKDGRPLSLPIFSQWCAPGDSCGFYVATVDSFGRWSCPAIYRFRRKL